MGRKFRHLVKSSAVFYKCRGHVRVDGEISTFLPIPASSRPTPKISVRLSARCFKLLSMAEPGAYTSSCSDFSCIARFLSSIHLGSSKPGVNKIQLNHYQTTKISDLSKLKQIADNILKCN